MNKILKKLFWCAWMLRYWALWKYRLVSFSVALICSIVAVVLGLVHEMNQVALPGEPRQAIAPIVWYIIITIISMIISYAMAPKPQDAKASKATAPQVKDGAGVLRVYGDVWIEDSSMVGWSQAGTEAIKSDGGKK